MSAAVHDAASLAGLVFVSNWAGARKNLTVLSGIGSEAYMQILPNRNAFEAELWVHKSTLHLRLVSLTEQSPSPDLLKAAAQKIAAKLP